MNVDIYKKLALHLDDLPAGFPATESGVELRILKRLFTPEQAELALHTTLIPEEAKVIALRAGLKTDEAEQKLREMVDKGLLFSIEFPEKPAVYMATQYVIGIWEYQVNSLDEELIRDMNEYVPAFVNFDTWKKSPQLRTVPVKRSVDASLEILPHEMAAEMVKDQSKIRVFPCICRKEHTMIGKGCDKPEESCFAFGMGAYYYERRGIGRDIDVEECLELLKRADKAGLVLQPNNAKKLVNICCCCGCCCQILKNIGKHPRPAELFSAPFVVRFNEETCKECGVCEERCQLDAITFENDKVSLDEGRCIGCGLCVSTCPSGSLTLERKPEKDQSHIPSNQIKSHLSLAKARGKLGKVKMTKMSIQSKWDRWLAKNR